MNYLFNNIFKKFNNIDSTIVNQLTITDMTAGYGGDLINFYFRMISTHDTTQTW